MVLQEARKSNKEATKMSEEISDEKIVDTIQYFIEKGWWCIKHDKGKYTTFSSLMDSNGNLISIPNEPICTECMREEREDNELHIEELSLIRAILLFLAFPFLLLLGTLFELKEEVKQNERKSRNRIRKTPQKSRRE